MGYHKIYFGKCSLPIRFIMGAFQRRESHRHQFNFPSQLEVCFWQWTVKTPFTLLPFKSPAKNNDVEVLFQCYYSSGSKVPDNFSIPRRRVGERRCEKVDMIDKNDYHKI